MVSQQSSPARRFRGGISFAVVAVVLASLKSLSGCQALSGQLKTLPPEQLKSELVTAPAGSKPFAQGTLSPDGILTLDQFVDGVIKAGDRSDEKRSMTDRGFKSAAEVNWDAPDGTSADVFLLQFTRSDGAQDFVSGVSQATANEEKPQRPLGSLPGISGGETWTAGAVDTVGNIRQSAWFSVGNIAADVHYYTPGQPDSGGLAQLARAQQARLTGNVTTPSPLPAGTTSAAPAPGTTSAAPAPAGTTAAAAAPADQNRLLGDLVAPPAASKPWQADDQTGPSGILTLNQFAIRYAQADRQGVIDKQTTRGFQYAVRENWNTSDGQEADIVLAQFATATGAQSYTLGHQSSAGDKADAAGTYPIPNSGDTIAYDHRDLDSNGDILTESYAVIGNIAIDVSYWQPSKAVDRAVMTALLQQQYAKLLADPTVATAAKAAPALPSATP
ncbi:hypothetical protein [Kitasatospora sp. NBC_01302]|uniref:hypothetical protein n=1 Tax=Kitasatospora sp. NBC_01302 TaxID=2903575 RepID=UPI002E11CC05|nr:hypothetical protein OG294_39185 [Kitasatospora sp. NBC_01302]